MILGNSLEIIPKINKVDHIITDPPYEQVLHDGVGSIRRTDGGKTIDDFCFEGIDSIRDDVSRLFVSISSGWMIIFCIAEGVALWRDSLQRYGAKYDTTLAWIKPDAMPRFNGQGAARGFECMISAWTGKGMKKWNGGGKRGIYTHLCNPASRHGAHPTEKPLALMKEIIRDFTNPDDIILDPFMGSGTTGVACLQMGRKFIGIEMNQQYFDISVERIGNAERQPDIFSSKMKQVPLL